MAVILIGALYCLTLFTIWKDRNSVLPVVAKSLRRRFYFNLFQVILCAGVGVFNVLYKGYSTRIDLMFGGYVVLQGFRAGIQAWRERVAWKESIVKEVMEL